MQNPSCSLWRSVFCRCRYWCTIYTTHWHQQVVLVTVIIIWFGKVCVSFKRFLFCVCAYICRVCVPLYSTVKEILNLDAVFLLIVVYWKMRSKSFCPKKGVLLRYCFNVQNLSTSKKFRGSPTGIGEHFWCLFLSCLGINILLFFF